MGPILVDELYSYTMSDETVRLHFRVLMFNPVNRTTETTENICLAVDKSKLHALLQQLQKFSGEVNQRLALA